MNELVALLSPVSQDAIAENGEHHNKNCQNIENDTGSYRTHLKLPYTLESDYGLFKEHCILAHPQFIVKLMYTTSVVEINFI